MQYHLMYADISYFLLDVRANQSSRASVPWSIDSFEKYSTFVYFTCIISSHVRIYLLFSFGCSGEPVRPCVSSLEYRFLWKIHYLRVLHMQYHFMYSDISYFLRDIRANQSSRAWVPSSIDSFAKYSTLVYFTCIISSHVRIYLLFSFGCTGEPVLPCVSSLQYRFLWKIHYLRVLYMQYHLMYADISYFLLDVRANQSSRAWVPWSIDSFEKYSTFVYFTCIISSHARRYLLFSFGYSGEPVRPSVSSLKYRFRWKIHYHFTCNIISCTQISLIFFWMFGRTGPTVREFPEV